MSETPKTAAQSASNPALPPQPEGKKRPERMRLYSYPKVVFLYPLFFVAIAIALYLGFVDRDKVHQDTGAHVATALFLCLLGMNFVVLAFDFPRTTSLTLFFFIAAAVMGAILLFHV